MQSTRWITIIIVCVIYGFIMTPIEKAIKKRLTNKWSIISINFIISLAILLALYAIADLLGYGI